MLKITAGSVPGSVYVQRGKIVLAEFYGHEARRNAETFIQALAKEPLAA